MPDDVARQVGNDEARLYELIWMRTVASQMADARGRTVRASLVASSSDGEEVVFDLAPAGKVIDFFGYMRAYVEGRDDADAALEDREVLIPPLAVGDAVDTQSLNEREHETRPPARYTEASLVKELEDRSIGRPSTYASIIETIQQRGYVFKKGSALVPSFTAFSVTKLLRNHFPSLVDYEFTAKMEDDLDAIAGGGEEQVPWLRRFYFGNGKIGLHDLVSRNLDDIDPREINSIPIGSDTDGSEVLVRVGRYGPYVMRGEDTASIPQDLPPDELSVGRAVELLEAPDDHVLGEDPDSGEKILLKSGRFGPYVQLGEFDEASKSKPKTASLFRGMNPSSVSLEDALRLLSIPRMVGKDPDGKEILALNGRYGPYLKRESDTRSLDAEEQIFTVTVDQAVALFAQPKKGRRASAALLKELGEDPLTGTKIVIKNGRYGPYATDGETNASLPRDMEPDALTLEQASEMLGEKRKNPPKKRTRKKSTPKTSARKKTTRKKSTRKKTTRRSSGP
jgi:DNA topoisomerase-1